MSGPWVPSVASFGGLGSAYRYRGEVTSPWPPESGRNGVRRRWCEHKTHKTVRLAMRCAQKFAEQLNAEEKP